MIVVGEYKPIFCGQTISVLHTDADNKEFGVPSIAAYESQERLHNHRSCHGSITLGRACWATGIFTSTSF